MHGGRGQRLVGCLKLGEWTSGRSEEKGDDCSAAAALGRTERRLSASNSNRARPKRHQKSGRLIRQCLLVGDQTIGVSSGDNGTMPP